MEGIHSHNLHDVVLVPIGPMYAIYGNICHRYTSNVSIYTIHGSYGVCFTVRSCCGHTFLGVVM